MTDYLIKNAVIVDGTGTSSYRGSVLLNREKVAKIIPQDGKGAPKLPAARSVIDAKGLTLAPGFIDIHSHGDWLLPDPDHVEVMEPLVRQGITTVVTGNCGFSPAPLFRDRFDEVARFAALLCDRPVPFDLAPMDAFFTRLERQGTAVNMAHLIGHATLRGTMKGILSDEKLGVDDLRRLDYAIDESFEAGAFGLSFGLGYPPGMFVPAGELEWFAVRAARRGAVLPVHLKAYSTVSPSYPFLPGGTPHNIIALNEALRIAQRTGVSLQISHLIFAGESTWKTADRVFKRIEKEYSSGLDVDFDAFAYPCGNTTIIVTLPLWFLRDLEENLKNPKLVRRLKFLSEIARRAFHFDFADIVLMKAYHPPYEKYEGKTFGQIASETGREVMDAYLHFVEVSGGRARIMARGYYDNESPRGLMARVLSHPLCKFETDTLMTRKGVQNPAAFGNFPKILGKMVREYGLMTLEEAVRKMTGASARKLGMAKRGEVREGYYADLVLFDSGKIGENPEPGRPPSGVEYVFINGMPALAKGVMERKKLHGRVLRKNSP